MRLNTLITLGASAAFGIMAVVLARSWINGAIEDHFRDARPVVVNEPVTQAYVSQPVLVADIDLEFGDEITRDVLRVVDLPVDTVPFEAFEDMSAIFGEGGQDPIIALAPIYTNEVILPHKVSGQNTRASLSARIKPGYRAAAIRVDDVTGVAGFVVPGDIVDVIYTFQPDPAAPTPVFRTDILLQSIKVLATDQNFSDQNVNPDVARTITLEVSHQDSQKLATAMEAGILSLSLRSIGETSVSASRPLLSTELANGRKKAARRVASTTKKPAIEPFDPRTDIIVFRGDEQSNVTVLSEDKQIQSPALSDTELAGG